MKRSELYRKAAEYGFKKGNDGACVWIAQATRGGSYMFMSNRAEIEAFTELFHPDPSLRGQMYWGTAWGPDFSEVVGHPGREEERTRQIHECRILALLFMSEISK